MHTKVSALSIVACTCILVWTAGCTGTPVEPPTPRDVAGTYEFSHFTFVPNATAIQPANVLDTLVTRPTLLLTEGGQFVIVYQMIGGPVSLIFGEMEVRINQVRLHVAPGNEVRMAQLLLPTPIPLNRHQDDPDLLFASIPRTADLAAYSGRYRDLPPIPGQLQLRMRRPGSPDAQRRTRMAIESNRPPVR